MSLSFIACAVITTISAAVSLGFSVAAAARASGQTLTMALYASARSLAFTLISVVPFVTASMPWLQAVAAGMIIVQVCDAGVGVTIRDRMKTFGPAGTAVANFAALVWVMAA